MTESAITPLRQRMIEDMAIRRLAPGTQAFYVSAIAKFARHFGCSPDQLGYEEVRAYQLHLVQSGLAVGAVNRAVTALRFFYKVTMGRRDAPDMIPLARRPEKLRAVLTPEEVARRSPAAPCMAAFPLERFPCLGEEPLCDRNNRRQSVLVPTPHVAVTEMRNPRDGNAACGLGEATLRSRKAVLEQQRLEETGQLLAL